MMPMPHGDVSGELSELKYRWRLVVYLMLLGSSLWIVSMTKFSPSTKVLYCIVLYSSTCDYKITNFTTDDDTGVVSYITDVWRICFPVDVDAAEKSEDDGRQLASEPD